MVNLDAFNFIFSLYSLLLGLGLAVILSGFAQVLKKRPLVPVGWLTGLLGIFIMLDVASFWAGAWRAREWFAPEYGYLFISLVITGLYYFAASLVFPDPDEAKTLEEFDAHYWANRRPILIAVLFCNLAVFAWQDVIEFADLPLSWWFGVPVYFALLIATIVTRSKRLTLFCLSGLIAVYVYSALLSTLWPWRD